MRITLIISILIIWIIAGCEAPKNESHPSANIEVSPLIGDTTTVFALTAERSTSNGEIPFGLNYFWTVDDTVYLKVDSTQSKTVFIFSKPGIHRVGVSVRNISGQTDSDTAEVRVLVFKKDSLMVDPRDGRRYSTVLLGDTWWFSENLKYGRMIGIGQRPANDGIVDKFATDINNENSDGYYTPEEAHLYQTDTEACICPPGWSLPDYTTIRRLSDSYWLSSQDKFFSTDGYLGLNLGNIGYYSLDSTRFESLIAGLWWGKEIYRDDQGQPIYNMMYMSQALNGFHRPYYEIRFSYPELVPFRYYQVALPIRCIKKMK